jgi:DNA-binding response OmpR family regulator
MIDNVVLRILFLGENPSWSKLSQAMREAPDVPLHVHRAQSPADAFRALSTEDWDALAIDLHAWSFQGLISLQKIRSEYPTMPLIALTYQTVKDVEKRAVEAGASRCLKLDKLTAWGLHAAVISVAMERQPELQQQKGPEVQPESAKSKESQSPATKIEVISHALNNLLCVISAHADILSEQVVGPEPAVHSIGEIKKVAKSAADLIHRLR